MRFANPYSLLFLLIIPLILILRKIFSKKGVPFSSATFSLPKTFRVRTAFIPELLMIIAFASFVVALARPQSGKDISRKVTSGLAIEMVVDRSSSMSQRIHGKTRLETVKEVFARFVLGDGNSLKGRESDMIGIVAFAGYADTLSPLTLSYNVMPQFIGKIQPVQTREEDGTAIGDAIALAAARLHRLDTGLQETNKSGKTNYKIRGKVMILLTDGENNAGEYQPEEAAKLAKEWGIKIYTIGIIDPRYNRMERERVETGLKNIAELTEGTFFAANNYDSLLKIYEEIDTLEKSNIETVEYTEYKEIFFVFIIIGLFSLFLSVTLRSLFYRRID